MKKFFTLVVCLVVSVGVSWGQTQLYIQNFGIVDDAPLPSDWNANVSSPILQILTSTAPPGGGANLSVKNCTPAGDYREFGVTGISSSGYTGISVRFQHRKTSCFTPSVTLEWSSDGVNWNTVSAYNSGTATTTWAYVGWFSLGSGADNQPNLRFRFSFTTVNPGGGCSGGFSSCATTAPGNFRIDDFEVQADFVLPVELLSFNAEKRGRTARLEWRTATEKDNDYFEIERSADGTAFASVGRVKGAGTTQIPQAYAFDDLDPRPGVNYYRLRQTDYDGASEYSPVVSLRMDGPEYVISPMPVSGTARVAFDKPTESDTYWQVFASDGALLRAGQVGVGEQGFEFDLNALPAGVYILRMEQANWAKSERIFKTTLR